MKAQLLKGLIVSHDIKQENLAAAMGLSMSGLYKKLSEKAPFTVAEALFIKDRYNLSEEEFENIFNERSN